jgi:glycosyltransferase involved in cell wall biosynthesis
MPMDAGRPILLVVRGLDPVGTGRQVEIAAAALAAAGHDVVVAVTSAGGSLAERLARTGLAVHRVGWRPVVELGAAARLERLARRLRPAAIVGFGRSQLLPVALAGRFVPGCRTVGWLGLPARGVAQRCGLRRLDAIVASSPGVAAACRSAGVAARRITVVPPGSVAEHARVLGRHELAARLGLDPAKHWTLCVAPLEPAARLTRLVWAIDQLGVVRKDLEHVLVGAGPLLDQIRRRGRAQELAERLVIVPECELIQDLLGEVRLVWQSGDVALGGAVLDGMARGVPVVAVESDAARELVVDGETGRVVPAVPESELPRRAFGILEDEALARRFGAAGAARAGEAFSATGFVAGLVAALRVDQGAS